MIRRDIKIVSFCIVIILIAVFMLCKAQELKATIAGTIGPGVFPSTVLCLLILLGLVITIKSCIPVDVRLLSPYSSESLKGLLIQKIAGILASSLGARLVVQTAIGGGFFSAHYKAIRSKPDGHTLALLSGSIPYSSCFLNASFALEHFEPLCLLSFDPYMLLLSSKSVLERSITLDEIRKLISSANVGFSCEEETGKQIARALELKSQIAVKPLFYDSVHSLVKALEQKTIGVGFCLASEVLNSEVVTERRQIIALTSEDRIPDLPQIPTLKEIGMDICCGDWMALGFPAGVSKEHINYFWSILAEPKNVSAVESEVRNCGEIPKIQGPDFAKQFLKEQASIAKDIKKDVQVYISAREHLSLYRVIASIGLFVTFVLIGSSSSYLLSSFCFLGILSIVLWPRKVAHFLPFLIGIAACISFAVYWIFSKAFNVVFP